MLRIALLPNCVVLAAAWGTESSSKLALDPRSGQQFWAKGEAQPQPCAPASAEVQACAPYKAPTAAAAPGTSPARHAPGAAVTAYKGRPLRFLHIEKTGTGFANTVLRLGMRLGNYSLPAGAAFEDESQPGNITGYYSRCYPASVESPAIKENSEQLMRHWPLNDGEADKWAVVTMLREPVERTVSHYLYFFGIKHIRFWDLVHVNTTCDPTKDCHNTTKLAGCMTKNIIGRPCEDGQYPSAAEVEEAKKRLAKFAFVGITKRWNESLCAAHRVFDAGPVYHAEKYDLRPTIKNTTLPTSAFLIAELRQRAKVDRSFFDWADEEIYRFGSQLFLDPATAEAALRDRAA